MKTDNRHPSTVHIIAGPTASGKTAKAIELAQKLSGVVINCDSLQVYSELPILTAQPGAEDLQKAPHKLYGVLHPNQVCSAGNWREMAIPVIEHTLAEGKTPIVCGGSGLYIRALMQGLSPIPDIPKDVREGVNALQKKLGNPSFHAELEKRDPVMAERLGMFNTARLIRAYEVIEATGKSLAEWQALPLEGPPSHWRFEVHKILPERDELYARCDARLDAMIRSGVLSEVAALDEKIKNGWISPGVPITKALGFTYLRECLYGRLPKDLAIESAKAETRHYAKRQVTWFRHQL